MSNNVTKIAYQETSDESFLYNYKPEKNRFSQPLEGVKLTPGLSPAEVALDNTEAVTSSNSDVVSKYASAHFFKGFFHKAEKEKKGFMDDAPVFENKGGASELQKGPPTMFSPGYDVGGGY